MSSRLIHALGASLNWRSLRWKIAALAAACSCAVALAVGLLVHHSTSEWSLTQGRGRALAALADVDAGEAYDAGALPEPVRRQLENQSMVTWYDARRPGEPWMWAARRVDGQVRAVRIDMGPDLRNLQALDRHMWLASIAVLAVVVPMAALAAELPNRRLRRVAVTARRIAGGDLGARIAAAHPASDEITEIAAAVDSMADSLQKRLLDEQHFTADVAHELRTPLMGLLTASELLPDSEATEMVRGRVRVLRTLVEDLLEVSRLDAGGEQADLRPVRLNDFLVECLARIGLAAELDMTGAAEVRTDPRRLDRIVANLVANAQRHGRPPVEVTLKGTVITVRDHGPGYPVTLLADGPQRFRTGVVERGRGHGLGLIIASGQAGVIGADLSFSNSPEGGAVATLRFSASSSRTSGPSW